MSRQLALTVRQPWASQIMSGDQDTEHRSWRTEHRGRLWIHAGLVADDEAKRLPRGVILGRVVLLGVVRGVDEWQWLLAKPRPLDVPVAARGLPGLWPVPDELLAELLEAETHSPAGR